MSLNRKTRSSWEEYADSYFRYFKFEDVKERCLYTKYQMRQKNGCPESVYVSKEMIEIDMLNVYNSDKFISNDPKKASFHPKISFAPNALQLESQFFNVMSHYSKIINCFPK